MDIRPDTISAGAGEHRINRFEFVGRVGDLDSLVAFCPDVGQSQREDIQDALLFAQMRASHLHDFQTQWHCWTGNYRTHLEQQGFRLRTVVVDHSLPIGNLEDLEQVRFSIASPRRQARLARLMRDSFVRLGIEDFVERFLSGDLPSANMGSFQIAPCDVDEAGELATLLCSLRLEVEAHGAGTRLILHCKGGTYRFDPAHYALRRKAVQDYLSGRARAVITRLDL